MTEMDIQRFISENSLCVLFFKSNGCGVCNAQLPRITDLSEKANVPVLVINLSEELHLAASQMVLNVPFTKVYHEGKEIFKEGAYLRLEKFEQVLVAYNQ